MNIYDIKRLTEENSPCFFSRETMKFFNQRLKDFNVSKMSDGRYRISAPRKFNGYTIRYFNPTNNKLELE